MSRMLVWLCGWCIVLSPAPAGEPSQEPTVAYAVDASRPESGKIQVGMTLARLSAAEITVAIPAWAPGAYRIVKYSKQVKHVEAFGNDGAPLEVRSVDDQTWAVKTGGLTRLTVKYELAVEKSRMDPDHCFLAGPDTYFYLVDHKAAPCRVSFTLPDGWRVGTALESDDAGYIARDYDTFVDCPTELGRFELYSFQADGATYDLVVHARGPVDGGKLTDMCRKIVKEQNGIFGGPPFKRYVFFYHLREGSGGRGLEHLNSTDITMPYVAIKADPYLAASVSSHEYFHLWNVKRIRPAELGPFDYTQIVRTKALWMCEGVTSYYGDRALERSGLWREQQYLDHLAAEIETLQNNPDRKVTPIERASQSVWDRKDWPQVDYYNKGELLGLLMDLRIRVDSEGEKSLDDVMRALYRRFVVDPSRNGQGPIGIGYPEDGIRKALEEVTGRDWKTFYSNYMSGVEELPFSNVAGSAGLALELSTVRTPDLGVDLRGTYIANVAAGSDAEKSGIKQGDRVIGINGAEVNRATLRGALSKLLPGEDVRVQLARSTDKLEVTLKLVERERTTCKLHRAENPSDLQRRVLNAWLGKLRQY